MNLTDKQIGLLGLAVALISVAATVIIGLAALNQSKALAIKSGSLAKPELIAYVGQMALEIGKTHRLIFGVPKSELNNGVVVSPYTIQLKNSGDAKLDNLYLTYRYHNMMKRDVLKKIIKYKMSGTNINWNINCLV